MTDIALAAGLVAGIVGFFVLRSLRQSRKQVLRLEGQHVVRGYKKTLERVSIGDLRCIQIAGLWDVAPADDCWKLVDAANQSVAFLGREPGASEVLQHLEANLPSFTTREALQKARNNELFNEFVDVWRAP